MNASLDLSQLIESHKKDKSYCVQCYMDKCSASAKCSNPLKGKAAFKKLVKHLNDPLQVIELRREVGSDANKKKMEAHFTGMVPDGILKNGFIYTTCLFCYSGGSGWNTCKNSREGRVGTIDLGSGKKATFCYPDVKGVKHRIQIGLHINFICSSENTITWSFLESGSTPTSTADDFSKALQPPLLIEPAKKASPKWVALPKEHQATQEKEETLKENGTEITLLKKKIEDLSEAVQKKPSILSLTEQDKRMVNDAVIRENIALKAYIHLLQMKLAESDFTFGLTLSS